jgi:CRP-like cAMP-binding protein
LRDPALGQAFELQLAFRSRLLYERLSSDPSLPLESRIARLLQTLGALYGRKVPEGISLEMRISQADLGDWMGVSRQRANFAVQQLRDANLISLRYSAITITDPKGLSARAMT